MAERAGLRRPKEFAAARAFAVLALACLAALVWMYLDTFELRPRRTVGNAGDARFRVVDFHSRPATEGEIYDVAEVPVIARVREVYPRRLRFDFRPPIEADVWEVRGGADGRLIAEGPWPEIAFPDEARIVSVVLVPRGVALLREIRLEIDFYPKDGYAASGLSWPDNYWLTSSSVPVSPKTPRSVAEWAGFRPDDPELAEARNLLPADVTGTGPSRERAERVFLFVARKLAHAGGTPSDAVQAASPLETYRLLTSGRGRGFCENRALVFYLFANAAGIGTRLVDMAGKLGPLKLTGHYVCESWIPEEGRWIYVDPQSGIAGVRDPEGRPLHAVGVKKAFDAGAFSACALRLYDAASGEIVDAPAATSAAALGPYFSGRPILAFKFGYGRNRSFSRLRHFARYPTLLYAEFPLPRLHLFKSAAAAGTVLGLAAAALLLALGSKRERASKDKGREMIISRKTEARP